MAGNHNSGRKSWDKEIESKKLWELSIPVLKHALNSEILPPTKKAEIALAIVTKMLPSEVKGEGFGTNITNALFSEGIDSVRRRELIEWLRAKRSTGKSA